MEKSWTAERFSCTIPTMTNLNVGDKVFAAGKFHGYGVGIIEGVVLSIDGSNVRVRWWNGETFSTNIEHLWK